MNKLYISLLTALSLTAAVCAHGDNGKNKRKNELSQFAEQAEARKAEIDAMTKMIDSTIAIQMKELTRITKEALDVHTAMMAALDEKISAMDSIIESLDPVMSKVETLYPAYFKEYDKVKNLRNKK